MVAASKKSGWAGLWIIPPVFAVEYIVVSLIPHQWFTLQNYKGAPIAFGLALLFFGRDHFRLLAREPLQISRIWISIHSAALLLLIILQVTLAHFYDYGRGSFPSFLNWVWFALILSVIGSLLRSFVSLKKLVRTSRSLSTAWIQAALCCVFVVILRSYLALSWDDPSFRLGHILQDASFRQVVYVLAWIGAAPLANPANHVLGTKQFAVQIASSCSGIEGLALISVLMVLWITIERRNLRVQRVLLLVPVALASMWVLNLIRLAVLILIGSAGHPDVAINGFHSQAGWIFFNCVSFGFLLTVQQVRWFRRPPNEIASAAAVQKLANPRIQSRNVAGIYLLPFLAITAGALLSRAFMNQFEWLYPLRLFAALIAFWVFRREYREMNWRFGLQGVAAGVAVAAFWIALYYATASGRLHVFNGVFASELFGAPRLQRDTWLLFRCLNAILTVPVAEELAFRGFVARRFVSEDVESVRYSDLSIAGITGSSIIFGALHGKMWLAGIVSGVVFAVVAKKRGRIGEAVAAHAVANLIITAVVLFRGQFALWS